MSAGRQVFIEKVADLDFHEAARRAVCAAVPLAFQNFLVNHKGDILGRIQTSAQHGRRPMLGTGDFKQFLGRGERHPRNPESLTEVLGDERFVITGHIEVELGLLTVAKEYALDYPASESGIDVLTVLHRDSRIGVNPLERDSQFRKHLVNLLLQRSGERLRRRALYLTDVKHYLLISSKLQKVALPYTPATFRNQLYINHLDFTLLYRFSEQIGGNEGRMPFDLAHVSDPSGKDCPGKPGVLKACDPAS